MQKTITYLIQTLCVLLLSAGFAVQATEMQTGALAPAFTLKTLNDRNLSLREYRGRVVMINFWATWCGPCRQEMPALNALYEKYRDAGFVLFGINVDADPANAARMVDRLKVTYPILFDRDKKASSLYQVNAMPMTILIDRDGKIRHVQKGYHPGYEDKYREQVRGLLTE
jgi:peroxiredoxin